MLAILIRLLPEFTDLSSLSCRVWTSKCAKRFRT